MRDVHHFIGGKTVTGTSGRFGDIYNPNTGEVQARVALATEAGGTVSGDSGDRTGYIHGADAMVARVCDVEGARGIDEYGCRTV